MNEIKERTVVVIGAGMAGLSAARQLKQAGISVTILEKNSYVGGRIHTIRFNGFDIEAGAQFIANFYSNTLGLIQELGLQNELFHIPGGAAILRNKRLYRLWTNPGLVFTPLLSFRSKLTLLKAMGPVLKYWKKLDIHAFHQAYELDTRSIAEYATRELNDELKDYILEPAISSLFHWTLEKTSQAMLFLLLKSGIGMKLFTLRHGLGKLAEAMGADLSVHCNAEVKRVTSNENGGYVIDAYIDDQQRQFVADGVVCATPSTAISKLFPDLSAEQRAFFEPISYSASVATVFALNHRLPTDLYGTFCSSRELKFLSTINISSAKDPAHAQADHDVMALSSSGSNGQELLDKNDQDIQNLLRTDLQRTGLTYLPKDEEFPYRVYRWYQALPYFDVGHFKRLQTFAYDTGKIEPGHVVFAGDYLGGPFIEGAITSGLEAAQRLIQRLE